MLVGLALISAAESNEKLVNQKYATLHSSYLGCPLVGSNKAKKESVWLKLRYWKKATKFEVISHLF